jgi:hypothetical protein
MRGTARVVVISVPIYTRRMSTPESVGTKKLSACTNSGRGEHHERVG